MLYSGTNLTTILTNNNDFTLTTLQPAVNFDSVSSSGYTWLVAKGPPNLTNYQSGALVYRRLRWTGLTPLGPTRTGWPYPPRRIIRITIISNP